MNQDDLGATVRAACQIIGGVLIAKGLASNGDVELYTGAAIGIASLVWSLWQKRQARAAKAAAVTQATIDAGG